MKKIIIINGPNLNLLGKREPGIYGAQSFEDFYTDLKTKYEGFELSYFQSNIEGELIDKIQEVGFSFDGIIFKCSGLYPHVCWDRRCHQKPLKPQSSKCISPIPLLEKSSGNNLIYHPNAKGVILGFGLQSYELALQSFL